MNQSTSSPATARIETTHGPTYCQTALQPAGETRGDTVETGDDTVETGGDTVETGGDTVETGDDTVEAGGDTVETGDIGKSKRDLQRKIFTRQLINACQVTSKD